MQAELDGRWLCGVNLDLTIYLEHQPSRKETELIWNIYRQIVPADRLVYVKNSAMFMWDRLTPTVHAGSIEKYIDTLGSKRNYGIRIWDGSISKYWSIAIQSMHRIGELPATSFLQVSMPMETSQDIINELTGRIGEALPFRSGHAGYSFTFDVRRKVDAFDQIYAWAMRYPGIDVQDLNLTLPLVLDRIKCISWLTMVGERLWNRLIDIHEGIELSFDPPVVVHKVANGVIIRAGEHPVMGDCNRSDYPQNYVTVAKALRSLLLEEHPDFVGKFKKKNATIDWLQRFVHYPL